MTIANQSWRSTSLPGSGKPPRIYIGADAELVLVHTVRGMSGNVHDVVDGSSLLYVEQTHAFGEAGYHGIAKRPDAKASVAWHLNMRPGKRPALNKDNGLDVMFERAEEIGAGIRTKVGHTSRETKRQFRYGKLRCRGLKKAAQLVTLFAVPNLWMVRNH